jgi:hypothetical protein
MHRSHAVARLGMLGSLAMLMAIAACNDDDDVIAPQVGTVKTFADPNVNWQADSTFAIIDSVVQLAPFGNGVAIPLTRQYDQAVIDQVRANLIARGYVEESDPVNNPPDFVVLVGASAQANYQTWVTYSWYTWYGFYPGWGLGFDPTWGISYPWATTTVTEVTTGTLIVTFVDGVHVNPLDKRINAMWAGIALGVLDGTPTQALVTGAVDEMFNQSPYITRY